MEKAVLRNQVNWTRTAFERSGFLDAAEARHKKEKEK